MNYSTDTPFNTYQEIKNAIISKQVSVSWKRTAAYEVSCYVNHFMAFSNLIVPFFSMTGMLLACQLLGINKLLTLFSIVSLPIATFMSNRLNGLLTYVAVICFLVPFFMQNVFWLVPIGMGIVGMMVGNYVWWGVISGTATKGILSDESLFEITWSERGLALRGYGKFSGLYVFGMGAFNMK